MTTRKMAVGLGLTVFAALAVVACNDTTSSCINACNHEVSCFDGGAAFLGPTFCQDSCNAQADAGYGSCTNPGAGYDCISGLSCADIIGGGGSGPSAAIQACAQKAGCDAGG